jgi:type II secretory pathway component PulK
MVMLLIVIIIAIVDSGFSDSLMNEIRLYNRRTLTVNVFVYNIGIEELENGS